MVSFNLVEIIRQHRSHVDSRLQNKLQNNIVKRPLVLPGAFCIVIKKQLRYNIYVVEMIRKLDTKARY